MSSPDEEFEKSLENAHDLLEEDDLTAFYVGTVEGGEHLDAASSYRADDPEQEGMQALSLLASHIRMVAEKADVDYETAARDAAMLADRVSEE